MRIKFLLHALTASLLIAAGAQAAQAAGTPYTAAAFDAALAAGQPAAVHFHADWCPTCRAQARALGPLLETPALKGLTLFVADYDAEGALKRRLRVSQQSTFVVFRQGKEAARSTGQTSPAAIAELLGKAF